MVEEGVNTLFEVDRGAPDWIVAAIDRSVHVFNVEDVKSCNRH